MEIMDVHVHLLLGKIRAYLDSQPEEKKKGKRFIEAQKALSRMEKIFAGQVGGVKMLACKKGHPVIPTSNLLACKKGHPVIPSAK